MNARCHKSVGNPAGLTLRDLVFFLHIIDIITLSTALFIFSPYVRGRNSVAS